MCGLLRYSLYGTRDAEQNWESGAEPPHVSSLKLTERERVFLRVERASPIKGELHCCNRAWRPTSQIGGERS